MPEDIPQGFVGFSGLQLDGVQLFDDLGNRPVGFGVAGVDVAAGGDVVVVLFQLGVIDDAAELLLLLPSD